MRRSLIAAAALVAAALVPADARAAGAVTARSAGDVDYLDPGATYYGYGFMVAEAVHRPLYRRPALEGAAPPAPELVPDLAEGQPEVGDGGRTVTVRLRSGVRFSPPVNREVVARDVEYAIERAFMRAVPNGYAAVYFGDLVGARSVPTRRHVDIAGVSAPDDRTLVLRLRRPVAASVVPFLTLPFTAPVPREYAARYDRRRRGTSSYGAHAAFTGPYRIARYRANRLIRLERNPSWDGATDPTRPAALDVIELRAGATNVRTQMRRIVEGSGLINGDGGVSGRVLRDLRASRPDQVPVFAAQGARWITLNTRSRTFRRLAARQGVAVGLDKARLHETRGGDRAGQVASHIIPPGIGGFDQAGGAAGPGGPFAQTRADVRGGRRLLKRAGVRGRTLRVVVDNAAPDTTTAREVRRQLRALGFRVRLKRVATDALFTQYCSGRKRFDVLVGYGWLSDAPDGYAMVGLPFSGPQSANNCSGMRSRGIDRAIATGKAMPAGPERDAVWAMVDQAVLEHAAVIPFTWDFDAVARSADVRGSVSGLSRLWDLSTLTVGG